MPNSILRTVHTVKGTCGFVELRLFGSGLEQGDQLVLVHRLEGTDRSACFGANSRHVTAKEQSDAGSGTELPYAPGAAGIVRDSPHDDTSQTLAVDVTVAHDPRWRADAISRRPG